MTQDERLLAQAEELMKRADALDKRSIRRFDHCPGSLVTGRSGRSRAMDRKHDRAIEGSLNDLNEAKRLRERAAKLRHDVYRNSPEGIAEAFRREAAKAKAKAAESAERKEAPILNRPCGVPIASAQWKDCPTDYKVLSIVQIGSATYRIRRMIIDGALCEVFLTDKAAKETT